MEGGKVLSLFLINGGQLLVIDNIQFPLVLILEDGQDYRNNSRKQLGKLKKRDQSRIQLFRKYRIFGSRAVDGKRFLESKLPRFQEPILRQVRLRFLESGRHLIRGTFCCQLPLIRTFNNVTRIFISIYKKWIRKHFFQKFFCCYFLIEISKW